MALLNPSFSFKFLIFSCILIPKVALSCISPEKFLNFFVLLSCPNNRFFMGDGTELMLLYPRNMMSYIPGIFLLLFVTFVRYDIKSFFRKLDSFEILINRHFCLLWFLLLLLFLWILRKYAGIILVNHCFQCLFGILFYYQHYQATNSCFWFSW